MTDQSPPTQGSQWASAPDSDSDSQNETLPKVNPRLNINPSVPTALDTVPSTSHTEDPMTVLRELRERENELSKRTHDIEKLLVSLTTAINKQLPGIAPSTPPTQPACHDNPCNPAFTPSIHTPHTTSAPTFSIASQASPFIYPESVIREALDLVPKFDGHNISVLQFARACKRAKELIPLTNESYLIRLLRNKLINHAYLAIEDETHDTVDKFIDSLKRTFGPSRSSNYYRGQLSVNYKKHNEHILDYIGRVKDLRNAIIEGDQNLHMRPLSATEISYIDSFTLESFIEGLSAEYRAKMRMEGGGNLTDAYSKAILVSKRLERDRARSQDPRNQQTTTPAPHPSLFPRTSPHTNPPVTILTRASAPEISPSSNALRRNPDPFPVKICGYCRNMGHLISECRKRQYRGNNNNNGSANVDNRQGNAFAASPAGASRGQVTPRPLLPLDSDPQPSTSSDPPGKTSQP